MMTKVESERIRLARLVGIALRYGFARDDTVGQRPICCRAALTHLGISGLAILLYLGNPLLRHLSYIQPRTRSIQLGYRIFSFDKLPFSFDKFPFSLNGAKGPLADGYVANSRSI
jgi:hypothetical protein